MNNANNAETNEYEKLCLAYRKAVSETEFRDGTCEENTAARDKFYADWRARLASENA